MKIRYKALILDHDDTAVDSTATIHYPAHQETMRRMRPDEDPVNLETWFLKNFDPGIMAFLTGELGFDDNEMEQEYRIWREFTSTRIPSFYAGFPEMLERFRSAGGRVAVVSHSEKEFILRDYRHGGVEAPELIFGWDSDPDKRKPHPWPVERILAEWDLSPGEALIVDDLKPAALMAAATNVPIAAAGWGHHIPRIVEWMTAHCLAWLSSIEELEALVFGERADAL